MRRKISQETIIAEATRLGIVNETKVRNLKIREKYNSLKKNGNKYNKCVEKLSEEFFISESAIEKVLHRTK